MPPSHGASCCTPDALSRGLAALAHPVRIEILCHLSGAGACCCKDVVDRLHMAQLHLAQSTVSQHLKVLIDAGLVRMRPERQRSRYTVNREALLALSHAFGGLVETCMVQAEHHETN
ncbi:metalloregulator ArsR/SmtB family transcription factor [Chelativorans sp. M5D2P16]|uniref:ArsR/SmtB family transcription factor n=1 Tax=Chelativorans sp. M5D2P16 TaxID=3095678 RepID=UPI002ACA6A8A|nr:metalloregulator ArsR/SmtB family transcription factor [Chelativorans sp. M5D2P16]MDZ5696267.1 metalloregulator ArsR/SmtB family transcription factor [Chelativorans sp. M5D2P16]